MDKPLQELVKQSLCDRAGEELLKALELAYVNRPSFSGNYDPYEAAVRDGERKLALTLINLARTK